MYIVSFSNTNNRYSYVLNNPLKFTDQSGYNFQVYDSNCGCFRDENAYTGFAGWYNWFGGLNQFRDGFYTTGGSVLGIGAANEGLFSDSFYASDYGLAWYKQNTGHDLERHNGQWGYWSTKTVHEGYANVRYLAGGRSYNVNVFNSVNGGGDPPNKSRFSNIPTNFNYNTGKPNYVDALYLPDLGVIAHDFTKGDESLDKTLDFLVKTTASIGFAAIAFKVPYFSFYLTGITIIADGQYLMSQKVYDTYSRIGSNQGVYVMNVKRMGDVTSAAFFDASTGKFLGWNDSYIKAAPIITHYQFQQFLNQ